MQQARSPLLPDVLRRGLKVVFCGTAPSRVSVARGAYYANPGNAFWRTLFLAGFVPLPVQPADFRRLPEFGLGLTDLAKHHFGNDDELPAEAFDVLALKRRVQRFGPAILAFTSKNAAQAALGQRADYGPQRMAWGKTQLWVLPSPSGQARRFWSETPWRLLATTIEASRQVLTER